MTSTLAAQFDIAASAFPLEGALGQSIQPPSAVEPIGDQGIGLLHATPSLVAFGPIRDIAPNDFAQYTTFAALAGGGYVAEVAKPGAFTLQVFDSASDPVGAPITVNDFAKDGDPNHNGGLKIAALTGGGFVTVAEDSSVASGQGDLVAHVYSATGVLQSTVVVDTSLSGGSEYQASVVGTADGGFQVVWTDLDSDRNNTQLVAPLPGGGGEQGFAEGTDVYSHAYHLSHGAWTSDTAGDNPLLPVGFFTDAGDQVTDGSTNALALLSNGDTVVGFNDTHIFTEEPAINAWGEARQVSVEILNAAGQPVAAKIDVRDDASQMAQGVTATYFTPQAISVAATSTGFVALYQEREIPADAADNPYYEGLHLHFYNNDGSSASADIQFTGANYQVDGGGHVTNADGGEYAKATALADGSGIAVVYSEDKDFNGTPELYIETFDMQGNVLTGPQLVTDDLQGSQGASYPQAYYQISTLADGDVHVEWEQQTSTFGVDPLQRQDFVFGAAGVVFTGTDAKDHPTLGAGADHADGQGGDDALIGRGGNDQLFGGAGNDLLDGGAGNDILAGGAGVDTASYADATAGVKVSLALTVSQNTGGAGFDTLTNIENLTGSAFNDVLTGDDGNNVLDGGAGDDRLTGGKGIDTASYADATSAVTVSLAAKGAQDTGGAGHDTLAQIENLLGSGFNDVLTGDTGANSLNGGAGDDTLIGGKGADMLTGGAGADVFVFTAVTDSDKKGIDLITDLTSADKIDLSQIDADTTKSGDQAFHIVAKFDKHAGELTIAYDAADNRTVISLDVNGDGKADGLIWISGDHHTFGGLVL